MDGVGLLRAEFMMAGIGVHPKKLIREGKKQLFIEKLASDLEMFCKPFNQDRLFTELLILKQTNTDR